MNNLGALTQQPQGGQTLGDLAMASVAAGSGQTSPAPNNFYNGLQMNSVGKFALMGRLQSHFGPNYNTHPDAQKIMESFNNEMGSQSGDLGSLRKLLDAGDEVSTWITANQVNVPGTSAPRGIT